jgi:hypothetical protein
MRVESAKYILALHTVPGAKGLRQGSDPILSQVNATNECIRVIFSVSTTCKFLLLEITAHTGFFCLILFLTNSAMCTISTAVGFDCWKAIARFQVP